MRASNRDAFEEELSNGAAPLGTNPNILEANFTGCEIQASRKHELSCSADSRGHTNGLSIFDGR